MIDAAHAVDEDLGALVLVLAATGARFSQARRIRVRDVLVDAGVILVPRSGKGTGSKGRALIRVPVQADVIEALKPLLAGRRGDETLLQRWAYVRTWGSKGSSGSRQPNGMGHRQGDGRRLEAGRSDGLPDVGRDCSAICAAAFEHHPLAALGHSAAKSSPTCTTRASRCCARPTPPTWR